VAAQAISRWGGTFFIVLFAVELLLYGLGTLAVRGRRSQGRSGCSRWRCGRPIATFLTNLVPWWRAASPGSALLGCVLASPPW